MERVVATARRFRIAGGDEFRVRLAVHSPFAFVGAVGAVAIVVPALMSVTATSTPAFAVPIVPVTVGE
ncbi:MAG TPA: hypothetical protein VNY31_08125 [Solirubrobacteraceae bacterium]|nr:hypothetical protein [Solirubrobacteraceae bacterium]